MRKVFLGFCCWLLFDLVAASPALSQCATNYTTACIGRTVCFSVTTTSQQILPPNFGRHYLLLQSQSTTVPIYFAIGPEISSSGPLNPGGAQPTPTPLVASIEVNTLALWAQTPPAVYEPPFAPTTSSHILTGAIAVITPSGTATICVLEHNG